MDRWVSKELYPEGLREVAWVPERLYFEGDITLINNEKNIAVVGTRKMSGYGQSETEQFVKVLVEEDWVIVSGLARGIDRVAHETCINNHGKTIAVLAHGLDMTYPPEHGELRKRIIENGGLVVSEHGKGTLLTKQNLAIRNRIIVAISKYVLVTESPKSSGTKITVKFAADQGKDVYVVPGPINLESYHGSVEIIRNGGVPVYSPRDLIENMS